jgi:hypothetical protein
MAHTYKHVTKNITIEVRQTGLRKTAWAHFVDGQYKGSKVLPNTNTAIPQNFGYTTQEFTTI